MLRLTTLGTIRFTGPASQLSPHPLLSQPKRLALFAYLALAAPGSLVFRDTLVALLWPDYEGTRAARALRQTLHHLRLELGAGILVGPRADGVALDPTAFWCDAVELERAAAEDRLETVLELYGGEFLPGFNPRCGPEFERWLDEVRRRLRQLTAVAAATLADRAARQGDGERALEYASRRVELLPYDEHGARVLMRLLARAGNRAAAVAVYDALAARLQAHLELDPDRRTRGLMEAVRAGDGEGLAGETAREPAENRRAQPRTLAVLPFAVLNDTPTERVLAAGVVEMLITELTRRGVASVVSRTTSQSCHPGSRSLAMLARALGVELVVEGTVLQSAGRVRVTAQLLVAAPEHHLWADSFERDAGDPLVVQAELASTLAARIEAALVPAPLATA